MDVASGIDRTDRTEISDCRYKVIESSSLVYVALPRTRSASGGKVIRAGVHIYIICI